MDEPRRRRLSLRPPKNFFIPLWGRSEGAALKHTVTPYAVAVSATKKAPPVTRGSYVIRARPEAVSISVRHAVPCR